MAHRFRTSDFLLYVLLPTAAFFLVYGLQNYEAISAQCLRNLDRQLMALSVQKAKTFEAYTGAYSQTGFRHPGPALFYYLAWTEPLFTWAFPSLHGAYKYAALLYNFLMILLAGGLLLVLVKKKYLAALLPPLFLVAIFRDKPLFLLADYWNASVITSTFLAYLLTATLFARGKLWALPIGTLLASLLMQEHIGTIPVVFFIFFVSFFLFLRNRKIQQDSWIPVIVSIVTAILVWTPPLYEALLFPSWGNIGAITASFLEQSPQTEHKSFGFIASFFSVPFRGIPLLPRKVLMVIFMLLPLVGVRLLPHSLQLFYILLVSCVAATFLALSGVYVPLRAYLINYFPAVVAGFFFLTASVLLIRIEHVRTGLWFAVFFSTLALTYWHAYPNASGSKKKSCGLNEEIDDVSSTLALDNATPLMLTFGSPKTHVYGAALTLHYIQKGKPVCVPDAWLFRYGRALTCSYQEALWKNQTTRDKIHLDIAEKITAADSELRQEILLQGGKIVLSVGKAH